MVISHVKLRPQIYYKVDNVEPWMSGNARGATSAFCLLVRLGQLKPTDEQVQQLLDHTDSPYIRAVGAAPFAASGLALLVEATDARHSGGSIPTAQHATTRLVLPVPDGQSVALCSSVAVTPRVLRLSGHLLRAGTCSL